MKLLTIFISALLIDNIILMRLVALYPFIGMDADEEKAKNLGKAVIFVSVLATLVTWPVYKFVLEPLGLVFLEIMVFVLIIAALVHLLGALLDKPLPTPKNSIGGNFVLIATNSAVLFVTFDAIRSGYNFIESIVYAFGVSLGFLLTVMLFSGIRRRIRISPIPSFLKGAPILFMTACLLSMAFMGFSGLVK